jgi:hypothetical protein
MELGLIATLVAACSDTIDDVLAGMTSVQKAEMIRADRAAGAVLSRARSKCHSMSLRYSDGKHGLLHTTTLW